MFVNSSIRPSVLQSVTPLCHKGLIINKGMFVNPSISPSYRKTLTEPKLKTGHLFFLFVVIIIKCNRMTMYEDISPMEIAPR